MSPGWVLNEINSARVFALQYPIQHISCMSKLANIALPVAIDREFTYLVPPELQESAVIGARAIVPFGQSYATGLIVGLPVETELTALKPIRDIIDASPIVSGELLGLCRWVASYYLTPLGEVLRAAVPHGFSASSKRIARLLPSVTEQTIAEMKKGALKRASILKLLADEGEMLSTELKQKTGVRSLNAVLNELEHAGYIETEEVLPRPGVKPKTKVFIAVKDVDDGQLDAAISALSPRKKKAAQILATLRQLKTDGCTDVAVTDLLQKSQASLASIREFRSNGLFPFFEKEVLRQQDFGTEEQTKHIVLNPAQQSVYERVCVCMGVGTSKTFLLHGVTGSGKTQVYIEAIRHCLSLDRTAIVLVPEISLTPQIVRRFKTHFGDQVGVVHSRMSIGERHDVWRAARRGGCKVVIGPRSAIFAPLQNLGLIVVDEEHEASYKQFDSVPRYHARDVAIVRGTQNNAVVLLGSATPSTESYSNATSGKFELLEMPDRIDQVPMPAITIVDMTAERKRAYAAMKAALPEDQRMKLKDFQMSTISALLQEKITDRIQRKEGVILLQNRRGFAPFVECPDCGYAERCDNCNVTLTYHLTKRHLRCHYCGLIRAPHSVCPDCKGTNIALHGAGTQRVEQDLEKLFPEAKVLRMDLDTTSRKGAHDRLLGKFERGEADILLGTQMVAKGLDFPRVTLVGVISADTQMLLPDFRSSERTFQLLTQVSGRAGRSALLGEVIIQTYQPQHYTLQHVVDHDFASFYTQELEARRELDYPPFSRLVLVETKGEDEQKVQQLAEQFARHLKNNNGTFSVLGPAPAVIAKINKQFRWHIIIKNLKQLDPSGSLLRHSLHATLASFKPSRSKDTRLIVDVDPVGLM
jgi:primosomal protein N' (replication factor Y) (superfamily II helicase)